MAVFSKTVSAGARIYYFDVHTDSKGNHYMTITEQARDGRGTRRSVFLYPENFEKFSEALTQTINYVKNGKED